MQSGDQSKLLDAAKACLSYQSGLNGDFTVNSSLSLAAENRRQVMAYMFSDDLPSDLDWELLCQIPLTECSTVITSKKNQESDSGSGVEAYTKATAPVTYSDVQVNVFSVQLVKYFQFAVDISILPQIFSENRTLNNTYSTVGFTKCSIIYLCRWTTD